MTFWKFILGFSLSVFKNKKQNSYHVFLTKHLKNCDNHDNCDNHPCKLQYYSVLLIIMQPILMLIRISLSRFV